MNYEDYLEKKAFELGLDIALKTNIKKEIEVNTNIEDDSIYIEFEDDEDYWNFLYKESEGETDLDIDWSDDCGDLSFLDNIQKPSKGLKLSVRRDKRFFINKDNKI